MNQPNLPPPVPLSKVQSTNAAALATMNEITSLLAELDPNQRARMSAPSSTTNPPPSLVSSTFDLSFFVWNEPMDALDLKQVTLSFPSNPGKILKSAETQFDEVVNIAELKVSPPTPATPSSSSSSKSLPNGRRLSSAGLSSSSPAPAAWRSSRPRPEPSARQPPMTKAEMRKVQKRFDSALDEMAEILSTGAHLDSMNNAPKRFTDSVDPDAVSIKQKTIRQILLNVRQIPSSDSDSPEMSSPPSDVLDRIVSVFHNELMVPQNKESRIISPRGRYVKTLRDILLQDGKKWRVFSEMLITVGPSNYDDIPMEDLPDDLSWFGWDFRFIDRPDEIDDENSTASRTDPNSIYKIFNAPVTSPDTLYLLIPPDFDKVDLLTFLESIFDD